MLDVGCEPWKAAIVLCLSSFEVWALQLRAPADEQENSSMFERIDAKVGQKSVFPSCENTCFSEGENEVHWFLKGSVHFWKRTSVWLCGTMALTSCYFCPSDLPPRLLDPAPMRSHTLTHQASFGDVSWWRATHPHLLSCRSSPFPFGFLGFTWILDETWASWLTSGYGA